MILILAIIVVIVVGSTTYGSIRDHKRAFEWEDGYYIKQYRPSKY